MSGDPIQPVPPPGLPPPPPLPGMPPIPPDLLTGIQQMLIVLNTISWQLAQLVAVQNVVGVEQIQPAPCPPEQARAQRVPG